MLDEGWTLLQDQGVRPTGASRLVADRELEGVDLGVDVAALVLCEGPLEPLPRGGHKKP